MIGLWLEDGRIRLRNDLAEPEPGPGEARLRVLCAGICGTDLELLRGYYPFTGVPGHEFVGRVETGPEDWIGRRVVGEINAFCGRCETCRRGESRHCPHRTVLGIVDRNGAFAEYLILPTANLHEVPEELVSEVAVFTEPLAAALEIQSQIPIHPGHRVLVVGDGRLGQLIARSLLPRGCRVEVRGRHKRKLKLLRDAGIQTLDASPEEGAYEIAVECTGDPGGFEVARRALRPRGTLVLKSTYAGRLDLDPSDLVVDEIHLIGSRCGPFPPALKMLRDGTVDVRPLIEARFPLERGEAALDHAGEALKVILEFPDTRS